MAGADWFHDAKFGIWAHWGPQSGVECDDWYARNMYVQGSKQYEYHVKI
jgi:alpha-L-fucosidase